ncbi:MAG: hypothetical protein COU10_00275 [Candidatus Harrisonbacteria bacterium CG10_big_fil_rev_8_21_14_0_10_45_28]|uniref:Uncharacterized protein n=1 Tax=Candidatus Harrisonbacteria bacterium CG10_big_fil_rev_8_21_14_0_10_45_28 TaxID=1974586 RepID=A0A2H0UPA3_9BACT|nr:MAG: hypothetical protein COU10_00275 [Candidatus Harrisonbacteria bacterium CG10_big_fil_rev_8_21_14_0_10_45_28]
MPSKSKHQEILDAIGGLTIATGAAFDKVDKRFDRLEERLDEMKVDVYDTRKDIESLKKRSDKAEDHEHRIMALEKKVVT